MADATTTPLWLTQPVKAEELEKWPGCTNARSAALHHGGGNQIFPESNERAPFHGWELATNAERQFLAETQEALSLALAATAREVGSFVDPSRPDSEWSRLDRNTPHRLPGLILLSAANWKMPANCTRLSTGIWRYCDTRTTWPIVERGHTGPGVAVRSVGRRMDSRVDFAPESNR